MINLLPYESKKQIRAARMNVILAKCLLFLLFAVIFLSISCTGAYLFLKNNETTIDKKLSANTMNDNPNYDYVISQSSSIQSVLSLGNKVLSQEILYSKIITTIGSSLPSGVIISTLSINNNDINLPITLVLFANSSEKSQEILTNFSNSSLFSNINIIPTQSVINPSGYPLTFTLTTNINKASLI